MSRPFFIPSSPLRGVILGTILLIGLVAMAVVPVTAGVVERAEDMIQEARSGLHIPETLPLAGQRSRVLAADGSEIGLLVGEQNRASIALEKVPEMVRYAVLAAEDQKFYEHNGIDHAGVVRAALVNARAGEIEQGGSTLTQQYVKNVLLDTQKTLDRKLREAIAAVEIEERLTKDEILERYMNTVYFGNGTYGIAAAAEYHFGKEVAALEPHEAAVLAGVIRRPNGLDPTVHTEAALARRNQVLDAMAANGWLEEAEAAAARARPLGLEITPPPEPRYPFVVEYVKQLLLRDSRLGDTRQERAEMLYSGGLTIHTTLDPRLQDLAEQSIAERLQNPAEDPLGALVSVVPDNGFIRTMAVGPKGFGECDEEPCTTTKVNPVVPLAGGSGRQSGSVFKPILDTAALAEGIGTDTALVTRGGEPVGGERCETNNEAWTPENYSPGPSWLDMPEAIRLSNNVYHARLINEVGIENVVEMAKKLGIGTPLPAVCSLGLGVADIFPLDLAQVYATFANDGVRCEPIMIGRVQGMSGETVIENAPQCRQVISPEIARTMTTMLQRVVENGTATRAQLDRPVAGKTGTTDDWKDAWFAGFIPQLTTVAWIGYEEPREMSGILGFRHVAGGTVPAMMWRGYMAPAVEGLEVVDLPRVELDRASAPPESIQRAIARRRAREAAERAAEAARRAAEDDRESDEADGGGNANGGGNGPPQDQSQHDD